MEKLHRNCEFYNTVPCPGFLHHGELLLADKCEKFVKSRTIYKKRLKIALKTILKIGSLHISNIDKLERIKAVLKNNC